jgi:hypothetical protein
MIIPDSSIEILYQYFTAFLLYTEIHFRFKFIGSKYFKYEPEILSDLPVRIEPGKKLPVLLIIKDAHNYPIHLLNIDINIYQFEELVQSYNKKYNQYIDKHFWYETIFTDTSNISGYIDVDVIFTYKIKDKEKVCHIHNYSLCTHNKMSTYLSADPYPNDGNVVYGDLHYHSNLTEDMVEFGAPIKSTLEAAHSMGLDFFCTTDHSYDLDDKPGSWTETDPDLKKWKESRKEIDNLNLDKSYSSFIIPSEELSLHNLYGKNIHALILNNKSFLPGAGDGAEKPFHFDCNYDTLNLYDDLEEHALCIAAHPFSPVPILQKLFFKRGVWNNNDIIPDKMIGLQILNGAIDDTFFKSILIWVKLLLDGKHKYIYAGNDAHGNFNIYRQINIPMISIKEKKEQIFGNFRTGVIAKKRDKNILNTINSLKKGNCFITSGPLLKISFLSNNYRYNMGSTIIANKGLLQICAKSSSEFGIIKKIVIKKGIICNKVEMEQFTIQNINTYDLNIEFEEYTITKCYFRCEGEFANSNGDKIVAFTNPIWLYPKK